MITERSMRKLLLQLLTFPPVLPTGTPAEILQSAFDFFEKWISRAGGLVAFAGAVKFAMATRTEDEKEIMQAMLVMVSGFMISEAVGSLDIFNIPDTYSAAAADTEFKSITAFVGKWTRRIGLVGLFAGSVQFGLSIKDNNAATKVIALKGMTAGAMVTAVSGLLSMFV